MKSTTSQSLIWFVLTICIIIFCCFNICFALFSFVVVVLIIARSIHISPIQRRSCAVSCESLSWVELWVIGVILEWVTTLVDWNCCRTPIIIYQHFSSVEKIPTTLFYIQKKLLNLSADSAKLSREIKIAQTLSDNSEKASNMQTGLETFRTNQRYCASNRSSMLQKWSLTICYYGKCVIANSSGKFVCKSFVIILWLISFLLAGVIIQFVY